MSGPLHRLNTLKRALTSVWLLSLLALVLISLLMWYQGPLLSFDGHEPLATQAWRWRIIVSMLLIWTVCFALHHASQWRANRMLMSAVGGARHAQDAQANPVAPELALLKERMQAAMAVLRKTRSGSHWSGTGLYQLPWYLFVGAPGSGKTTALTHSGLQFPLSQALGSTAIAGIGGTRHCDWWFTDEAVLLDTAGRYTTQDSDVEADKAAWEGFLDLLKKYRRRQPINGVIVTLSVSDLLQHSPAERQAHALAIRARIHELHDRLGLRFPVYVVVTKCDLIAGFAEFFEPFGRQERSQVWGMTFPVSRPGDDEAPQTVLSTFASEFDALERQLQARVLDRMQQERDLSRRALLYSFPAQVANIGEAIGAFLNAAFEPNRYQQCAWVRGVYLTSGTQQGSPIDRVVNSLAASFGLAHSVLPAGHPTGRSFFITRLMREVIFKEAGLAGIDFKQAQRRKYMLYAVLTLAGIGLLSWMAGMGVSYHRNEALVDGAATRTAEVAGLAEALPGQGSVLMALPLLNAARDLPAGFAHLNDNVSLLDRFGLYQGEKLGSGAVNLYRRLLRSTLLPQIVDNMESTLRRGDAGNQAFLYETLRVYLMLGERRYYDAASVQAWVDVDWQRELPQATQAQRQQLSEHVAALLDAADQDAQPVALDASLIAKTRLTLAGMAQSQRIYNRLKRELAQLELPQQNINAMAGRDVSPLLVRRSGAPLSRGVSGVYSLAGYRELVSKSEQAVVDMAKESWVLDRQEARPSTQDTRVMKAAVLDLYEADYTRQWDAYLSDIQLVSLSSLDQASRVTRSLAAADSPLRRFLQAAARQTTLDGALTETPGKPGDSLPGSRADDARARIESSLGVSPPAAPQEGAVNPVDRHFDALHKLVDNRATPLLDELNSLFDDAAQYFDGAQSARRAGTPIPPSEVLNRVRRAASEQPAPLSAILRAIDVAGESLTLDNERERLNALWEATGAPFCRDAIAGRYPLVSTARRDVTADDFGKFFGPGAIMDDFFNKNLRPYVDMSAARWRWRATGDAPIGISQDVLDQFQRAARLRDMFFVADARQPSLRFDLKPVSADPALGSVTLDVAGQPVAFEPQGGSRFIALMLPSGKGSDLVQLRAGDAAGPTLRTDGPWAWLHMLDQSQISGAQGERYQVTFSLAGRKVVYELQASSVINPFRRDTLEQFRCPTHL